MDRTVTFETDRGFTFRAMWLGEHVGIESLSLRCTDDVDANDIKWPSDAEVSAAVGRPVKFWDAGDDLDEAIYSVRAA